MFSKTASQLCSKPLLREGYMNHTCWTCLPEGPEFLAGLIHPHHLLFLWSLGFVSNNFFKDLQNFKLLHGDTKQWFSSYTRCLQPLLSSLPDLIFGRKDKMEWVYARRGSDIMLLLSWFYLCCYFGSCIFDFQTWQFLLENIHVSNPNFSISSIISRAIFMVMKFFQCLAVRVSWISCCRCNHFSHQVVHTWIRCVQHINGVVHLLGI